MTSVERVGCRASLVSARPIARWRRSADSSTACRRCGAALRTARLPVSRSSFGPDGHERPTWCRERDAALDEPSRIAASRTRGSGTSPAPLLDHTPPTTRTWRLPIAAAMTTIGSARRRQRHRRRFRSYASMPDHWRKREQQGARVSSVGRPVERARAMRVRIGRRGTRGDGMTTAIGVATAMPLDDGGAARRQRPPSDCGSLASRPQDRATRYEAFRTDHPPAWTHERRTPVRRTMGCPTNWTQPTGAVCEDARGGADGIRVAGPWGGWSNASTPDRGHTYGLTPWLLRWRPTLITPARGPRVPHRGPVFD
jgi:hypothetical protein